MINKFSNIDDALDLMKIETVDTNNSFVDSVFQLVAVRSAKQRPGSIYAIISGISVLFVFTAVLLFSHFNSMTDNKVYDIYRSNYVNSVATAYSLTYSNNNN